ncbi:LysR substrate-binding domain-containing protein [Ruegeria atlantica]|uniref:LysR substrate-binding domain-containing protein n=1 Tax=Ruegeria atlantica TaxID=81569 RepID=UPI0020C271F4|nr:LysR substrate-binding domain-containing protein [Ruegeria atlantica]
MDKRIGSNAVCEVNSPRSSLDLALAGLGIAVLPTFIGDTHGTLLPVGRIISELTHDQWLVTHQDDRNLPEVRRTIERMRTSLQRRQNI